MKCYRCDKAFDSYAISSGLVSPHTIEKVLYYLCLPCVSLSLKEWIIRKLEIGALKES